MSPPMSPALRPPTTFVIPSAPPTASALPAWLPARCGACRDGERLLVGPEGTDGAHRAAPPPLPEPWHRLPAPSPVCPGAGSRHETWVQLIAWVGQWVAPAHAGRRGAESPTVGMGTGTGGCRHAGPRSAPARPWGWVLGAGTEPGLGAPLSRDPPRCHPGLPRRLAEATRWHCEATVAVVVRPPATSRASPGRRRSRPASPAAHECPLPATGGMRPEPRRNNPSVPRSVPSLSLHRHGRSSNPSVSKSALSMGMARVKNPVPQICPQICPSTGAARMTTPLSPDVSPLQAVRVTAPLSPDLSPNLSLHRQNPSDNPPVPSSVPKSPSAGRAVSPWAQAGGDGGKRDRHWGVPAAQGLLPPPVPQFPHGAAGTTCPKGDKVPPQPGWSTRGAAPHGDTPPHTCA